MKKFITNLLIIAVFVGVIGYIGYNVKKANPDFGKDIKIQKPTVLEKLEAGDIEIEEVVYKDESNEEEDGEESKQAKLFNLEVGEKALRNYVKYLKHIDAYEKEFFEYAVDYKVHDKDVINIYNEIYNEDLINNDIVGEISVSINTELEEGERLVSQRNQIFNYIIDVPLSNNTTKTIEGEVLLMKNGKWYHLPNKKRFDIAYEKYYSNSPAVTESKQEEVLLIVEKSLYEIVEIAKEDKGYESLRNYYAFPWLSADEENKIYKNHYNQLSKLFNEQNAEFTSISIRNEKFWREEKSHDIQGNVLNGYEIKLPVILEINSDYVSSRKLYLEIPVNEDKDGDLTLSNGIQSELESIIKAFNNN